MSQNGRESLMHQEAKDGIAAVLREAGYRVEIEYSPHIHELTLHPTLRRIDIALPDERIAIEVWVLQSVARSRATRERAAELMRNGWSVIDVLAGSWRKENVLFAVQAARTRQSDVRLHINDLAQLLRNARERVLLLRREADELAYGMAIIEQRLNAIDQVVSAANATHTESQVVAEHTKLLEVSA